MSTNVAAYSVVPNENSKSVTLNVMHSCGHAGAYFYGGAEFAERDAAKEVAGMCIACTSKSRITQTH